MRDIHRATKERTRWIQPICQKYNLPRAQVIQMLSKPGALEHEIAGLINDWALAEARKMMENRDWPDESSDDLYDRAVAGWWRKLRDAEIAKSAANVAELKAGLQ